MYKPSSKLPHWHRESSPSYRRAALSRRHRLFIILAIAGLLWYRYFKVESINESQEFLRDRRIARSYSYPLEPQRFLLPIVPHSERKVESAHVPRDFLPHGLDTEAAVEATHVPRDVLPHGLDTEAAVEAAHVPREVLPHGLETEAAVESADLLRLVTPISSDLVSRGEAKNEPLVGSPTNRQRERNEDGISMDPPVEEASPEYAGEDMPRKQAVLDTRTKGDSGPSDIMPEEPTMLVRQASEKVVEQHRTPAVSFDEVKAGKEESANKQLSQKSDIKKFPTYSEYVALDEKGEVLPDIVHVPFEDSTADVKLQGWEDQWYSEAELDIPKWGEIPETKIDFVYTWVNGSEDAFRETIYPYEVNSSLNDPEGKWLESHRVNRYRDWDELRYSIRSVEKYAGTFRNKIQLLVNAVGDPKDVANATVENPASIIGKQRPMWLKNNTHTRNVVQVLSQEDFFDETEQGCLPTFNSLTIENQIFNTKSDTDRIFALSDDMLLGKPHAASDIYSPLFGPTMGFKTNSYNTVNPPTDVDARRFGEKPFLIYTSWLLNRRFGERKRKGQIHFGHSISRSVTGEAIKSFPRPALQSACQRFRGETGFQLYSWYVAFHYTIERHREALLWSYIMLRSDTDRNGNLGWEERQKIMEELEEGMAREGQPGFRKRMFFHMSESLEEAGLEPPKVNVDVQWTSLDGPATINNIACFEFNVNECLAPGFSTSSSDENHANYIFNTAIVFDRVARQHPKCGDCLIKLLLNRVEKGLSPLLPFAQTQAKGREIVIKALWKYQYVIVDPDAYFVMITDAEQVENVLFKRLIKRKGKVGQLCLNDDVSTEEESAVENVRKVMIRLLKSMVPEPSAFEKIPHRSSEETL